MPLRCWLFDSAEYQAKVAAIGGGAAPRRSTMNPHEWKEIETRTREQRKGGSIHKKATLFETWEQGKVQQKRGEK